MELAVHTDKIIKAVERLKAREASRASDVGADREEIASLLELTGLNKVAFSWVRRLDRLPQDKRDDILRSWGALLPVFEGKWNSQHTPDFFETAADPADDDAPEADEADDDLEAQLADAE